MISLDDFRIQKAGTAVSYDNNPANKGQCVQLMEMCMWRVDGITPPLYPGAADYFEKGVNGYEQLSKDSGHPRKGDYVFFQRSIDPYGNNGHVSICFIDGDDSGYLGFDTNWDGKTYHDDQGYPVAHDVRHDYSKVTGYLRKKGASMAAQDVIVDQQLATKLCVSLLRRDPDPSFFPGIVGQPLWHSIDTICASAEYQAIGNKNFAPVTEQLFKEVK